MSAQRHTPAALYPRERPGIHCTGGWVGPRAGLDMCEKSRPRRYSIPDRPARSQSLYQLSYPAREDLCTLMVIFRWILLEMRNISNIICTENQNTHLCSVTFYSLHAVFKGKGKGKAIPLQALSGPEGSRKLRFPEYMTTAQDGGKVVNLTHRPFLPQGNTPGTHFC